MRIIAGSMRGKTLQAPEGLSTRPILDRVKAALFDVLGARLAMPGELPEIDVLDIFCGGGSLGIEALSRGASSCTFVESEQNALACLRDNLSTLGLQGRSKIVVGSADRAIVPAAPSGSFGLIFVDPPYRLSEECSPGSALYRVMERLGREVHVASEALLVWRLSSDCSAPTQIGGWQQVERRSWGTMSISFMSFEHGSTA